MEDQKEYKPNTRLSKLEINIPYNESMYITDQQDIDSVLESIAFPKKYKKDITGIFCVIYEGDYIALWLSESSIPYDLTAIYHSLPYYLPSNRSKKYLPEYWLTSNDYYQF